MLPLVRLCLLLFLVSMPASASDWAMLGGDAAHSARSADLAPVDPQRLWSANVGAAVYASPVIGSRSVFVVAHDQQIHALDVRTGRTQWTYAAGGPISATPVLVGDLVVIAAKDGIVTALDARSGKPRWEVKTGGAVLSSPVADSGMLYFGSNDFHLYAVRLTGEVVWRYFAADYKYGGLYGSPAVDAANVYIGGKNGVLHAVHRKTGTEAWQAELGSSIYAPPVVAGDRIYVGAYDRQVYAVNTASGEVVWRMTVDDWPQGGATLTGNLLLVGTRGGTLHGLTAYDGTPLWTLGMGGELRHAPVLGANGIGVLGSYSGQLFGVDVERGRILWRRQVDGAVFGQPALADQLLYVATLNGEVSAWR